VADAAFVVPDQKPIPLSSHAPEQAPPRAQTTWGRVAQLKQMQMDLARNAPPIEEPPRSLPNFAPTPPRPQRQSRVSVPPSAPPSAPTGPSLMAPPGHNENQAPPVLPVRYAPNATPAAIAASFKKRNSMTKASGNAAASAPPTAVVKQEPAEVAWCAPLIDLTNGPLMINTAVKEAGDAPPKPAQGTKRALASDDALGSDPDDMELDGMELPVEMQELAAPPPQRAIHRAKRAKSNTTPNSSPAAKGTPAKSPIGTPGKRRLFRQPRPSMLPSELNPEEFAPASRTKASPGQAAEVIVLG